MKRTVFLLISWLAILSQVQAQVQFFQERVYRLNATGKVITASTLTRQGKVLFAGPVSGVGRWDKNVFMLIEPNLDTIWSRVGQKVYHIDQSIKQTSNNNFISGSNAQGMVSPVTNQPTILLQKFDSFGFPIWTNYYTTALGTVRSVYELQDKDLFMAAGFAGNGFPFIRTDSLGNVRWQKDYTWSQYDNLVTMCPAQNGNFIAAGVTRYPVPVGHLKLMLVNANGDSLNGTQLIATSPSRYEGMRTLDNSLLSLSDGGFLVSGTLDTTINTVSAGMGMLVKVNSNLQAVWSYIYRATPSVWRPFSKMRELADGSIIALAYDYANDNIQLGSNNFYLYYFSPSGQLLQIHPFTSTLATRLTAYTLEALPDSSFIVGGKAYNATSQQYGFYAAKVKVKGLYNVLPLISGTSPELSASENSLSQSYPNPTTAEAIISYSLPKNYRKATITIREIATGREVKSYALKKNSSSLKVDVSSFSNGLYLYSLIVDEKPVATKKLAVMK